MSKKKTKIKLSGAILFYAMKFGIIGLFEKPKKKKP
jgi:hypothetical protein